MEATVRQVGGGVLRVDATPCLKVSRCPYAVARERGGNLRTRVWVKRGIPWIYPRDKARRKVERGGTETSVVVRDKASGRQRSEREESRVNGARTGWGRDREEPKVRG